MLNMLGPLLNPAHAEYGLVGVYSPGISELMANSLLQASATGISVHPVPVPANRSQ